MPLSRFLLTLLLVASIPLQGIAASVWWEPPCPMEQMMMSSADMDMAMHQMDEGAVENMDQDPKPDCCLDDETALRTGQHCKQGQSCHAGQVALAMASDLSVPAFAHRYVVSADLPFKPLLSLVAIWRPPALA